MPDHQIRDELLTLFFAGYSTTEIGLNMIWKELASNPEIEKKLHDSLSVIKSNGTSTWKTFTQLQYCNCVVKETLRQHPPSWLITRQVLEDCSIRGYSVSKNTILFISPYITHHHPAFWKNPSSFHPERFLPENQVKQHPYAFIPFSSGLHHCIGEQIALLILQQVTAEIAKDFRLCFRGSAITNEHEMRVVKW
jgi:cytochrome P450